MGSGSAPSASASTSSSTSSTGSDAPSSPPPPSKPTLTFYPAYCNPASPTWDTWVKLSAHDVHHTLQPRAGYTTSTSTSNTSPTSLQNLPTLFYLNHPIRLIQIVGVVVALDEFNARLWLLTLDDGSGETIEAVCAKSPQPQQSQRDTTTSTTIPGQSRHKPEDPTVDRDALVRETALSNLSIGTIIQAKGSITTFRSTRQLNLLRLTIIPNTATETLHIEARTRTLLTILCKPWTVSPEQQAKLLQRAQGVDEEGRRRRLRLRDRERRQAEREERYARRIEREYEVEERERERAGEKVREAGVRLARAREEMRRQGGVSRTNL